MTAIIITEEAKLRALIQEELSKAIPTHITQKEEIDSITLDSAIIYLEEQGYPVSKAKMYKLTSSEEIPCRKFGQKLVFSRKDLLFWAEAQSKPKNSKLEAIKTLAESAKRKIKL